MLPRRLPIYRNRSELQWYIDDSICGNREFQNIQNEHFAWHCPANIKRPKIKIEKKSTRIVIDKIVSTAHMRYKFWEIYIFSKQKFHISSFSIHRGSITVKESESSLLCLKWIFFSKLVTLQIVNVYFTSMLCMGLHILLQYRMSFKLNERKKNNFF